MRRLRAVLVRLAGVFSKRRRDSDFAEELESHLRMHIEDNLRAGMTSEEARRQALIKLGGIAQTREHYRERLGIPGTGALIQDIRYGFRQLRRNPGFTAVAVITLALGIGANTASFSLIDAVMVRSMPVRKPSQLFLFRWKARRAPRINGMSMFGDCPGNSGGPNPTTCSFTLPVFEKFRSETNLFSGVTAFAGPVQLDVSGNGPPTIALGELVSGDYFSTLGVRATLGRVTEGSDDTAGSSPAAVLSYAYWQTAFGGQQSVIGRTIALNNVPFTIVGVADPAFTRLTPGMKQDFWLPLALAPRLGVPWAQDMKSATNWWLVVVGRLRSGVPLARAQAAASLLFRNEMLHGAKPLSKPQDNPAVTLVPAQEGLTGLRLFFSTPLYVLMAAVGIILLIACANVAGLLLARATARHKEIAVRLAVGAGRGRICRQLLTESVLLSTAGGALGVLFAYWGIGAITALMSTPWGDAFPFDVRPDPLILLFTISISVLTGILFGLAPALRSTRVDLTPALKESASTAPELGYPRRRLRLGSTLVIAQVGLSVVVLVGAGLLVRTLENLRAINPGFDTHNILLFGINPTLAGYKDARTQNLYRTLQARLEGLPGVASVSYSTNALLSGSMVATGVRIEDQPGKKSLHTDTLAIGPAFLRTMHIPLLEGRTLTAPDFEQAAKANASANPSEHATKAKAPPANTPETTAPAIPVLVNRTFVHRYLHNQNPLGKRLIQSWNPMGHKPPEWEIVGVVGDAKYYNLKDTIDPTVYIAKYGGQAYFELRTASDPKALIPAVRRIANDVDSRLPLVKIQTQTQQVDKLLVTQRAMARLASLFGVLAGLLACIGLYGLLSYDVTRRTREIGIRVALGANRSDVLRIVTGRGLLLVLIGVAAGIFAAVALTRFLASLLYGVKPTDPTTFAAVALVLAGVALLACYIPARRATRIDPMCALRHE